MADKEARVAASFIAHTEKSTSGQAKQQFWKTHLSRQVGIELLKTWATEFFIFSGVRSHVSSIGSILIQAMVSARLDHTRTSSCW
jgi:hypothetical protein